MLFFSVTAFSHISLFSRPFLLTFDTALRCSLSPSISSSLSLPLSLYLSLASIALPEYTIKLKKKKIIDIINIHLLFIIIISGIMKIHYIQNQNWED